MNELNYEISRDGALTRIQLVNFTQKNVDEINDLITYKMFDNGGVSCNRKESNIVIQYIEQKNIVKETKIITTPKTGKYIELASVARLNKLNMGKTWYCTSNNVDKNSLHPSWENEEICYVYNNR